MAFRKTVRSTCRFVGHCFGFSEPKFVSDSKFGSGVRQVLKCIGLDELSSTSLPMFSFDTVRRTGRSISGDVSFAPSDPAGIESNVVSAVSDFTHMTLEMQNSLKSVGSDAVSDVK